MEALEQPSIRTVAIIAEGTPSGVYLNSCVKAFLSVKRSD